MQGDASESRADTVQHSSDGAREKYGFVDWILAAFILVVIVSTVVGVPGLIIASFVYFPFPYNILATVAVIGYFPLARFTGQCWPEIIVQFGISALLLAIFIPAVQPQRD